MVIVIDHGVPKPPSREQLRQQDDAELLRFLTENPQFTQRDIAEKLGWLWPTGSPNPLRVRQAIKRLRNKGQLR